MGDEALIRRESLRRVMRERGLSYRDLEVVVGGRYTYWRDLLAENSTKSFGEKAARKVEEKLRPPLPRGYLDQPGSREAPSQPAKPGQPPAPPPDFSDRREISDSDWATLEAVKLFIPEHELAELRARADRLREQVLRNIGKVNGKSKAPKE